MQFLTSHERTQWERLGGRVLSNALPPEGVPDEVRPALVPAFHFYAGIPLRRDSAGCRSAKRSRPAMVRFGRAHLARGARPWKLVRGRLHAVRRLVLRRVHAALRPLTHDLSVPTCGCTPQSRRSIIEPYVAIQDAKGQRGTRSAFSRQIRRQIPPKRPTPLSRSADQGSSGRDEKKQQACAKDRNRNRPPSLF